VADLLQTTFDEAGEAGGKPTQVFATVKTQALDSARITSEPEYGAWYLKGPGRDGGTHSARTYRTLLVLVLAMIGGLVGVYGIRARASSLRTEVSAWEGGKISPKDPRVLDLSASAIPGSYDDKGKIDWGMSAGTERKDVNQNPDIARGNPINSLGNYRELHSSSFEISIPKPQVRAGNVSSRIERAKGHTQPKILEGQYIDIDLSAQILSIFKSGKLLDSYIVSTGKRGMETPKGTHAIANKFPRAWSKKYGMFMPFWMAITPGGSLGIHELPELSDGYKEGADELGNPVSHGCVRLGIGPAERVYNWAEVGTPVVVY
jgi:lipoprotein-anchoring transpeptidase ErfK/SrfK